MKKILFPLLILLFIYSSGVRAQYTGKDLPPPVPPALKLDNMFWGGDIGAYFGPLTQVNIAPTIGYKLSSRLEIGLRGTYLYFNDEVDNISTSMYGGSVFGRINITEMIFVQAEFEVLNIASVDFPDARTTIDSRFIGAGIRRPIGQKSYTVLTVLWDLDESIYSPYSNPVIRFGFNFGF